MDQSSTEPQYCYRSAHIFQTMTFNKNLRCSGFQLYVAHPGTVSQCVGSTRTWLSWWFFIVESWLSHLGFSHFWFCLVVVISSSGSQREHDWLNCLSSQTLFTLWLFYLYCIIPWAFQRPSLQTECTFYNNIEPNFFHCPSWHPISIIPAPVLWKYKDLL